MIQIYISYTIWSVVMSWRDGWGCEGKAGQRDGGWRPETLIKLWVSIRGGRAWSRIVLVLVGLARGLANAQY